MVLATLQLDAQKSVDEIARLSEALRDGSVSESIEASIQLDMLLGHLCVMWHTRHWQIDERINLPVEEYLRLCATIPNWRQLFRLVDTPLHIKLACNSELVCNEDFRPPRLADYLLSAQTALSKLTDCTASMPFVNDDVTEEALGSCLSHLCCGWHLSHTRPADERLLTHAVFETMSRCLPRWGVSYVLVSPR